MEEPEIGSVVLDNTDEKWEREPEGWRRIADGLDPRAGFRGLSWENLERFYGPLRPAREQRTPVTEPDNINHPSHYTEHPSGVECIQITEHMNFCLGNATKYLFRRDGKGKPIDDMRKSIWYIDREIERLTTVTWAVFPEDERYEVSTAGQVRRKDTGRARTPVPIKSGYHTLLFSHPGGKPVLRYVHRMVARTFFGEIREGMHVCHSNGIRSDNRLANLHVATPSGNYYDRRRHGRSADGEGAGTAKLTSEEVLMIRNRPTENHRVLADEFGMSRQQIQRILAGAAWRDPRVEFDVNLDTFLEHEQNETIGNAIALICHAPLKDLDGLVRDLTEAKSLINQEIERVEAQNG